MATFSTPDLSRRGESFPTFVLCERRVSRMCKSTDPAHCRHYSRVFECCPSIAFLKVQMRPNTIVKIKIQIPSVRRSMMMPLIGESLDFDFYNSVRPHLNF